MLTFRFCGADGMMTESEVLTSGMVGKEVRLEFSDDWKDMSKTAVFAAGSVTKDVPGVSDVVVIPAEVLMEPAQQLYVGIYGVSQDGKVTPTVWVTGPRIRSGTDPSGDTGTDPTLPVWAEIQAQIDGLTKVVDVDFTRLLMDFNATDIRRFLNLDRVLDPEALVAVVRAGGMIRGRFLNGETPVTVPFGNTSISEDKITCSGTLAECYIGTSPKTRRVVCGVFTLYIQKNNDGYDVYLDCCMAPAEGISAEQAAQIQANADAIANLPILVAEDGYTEIKGLRQATAISVVRDGQTVTVTSTMQGGVTYQDVIALDQQDVPVSLTSNDLTCHLEFIGFEENSQGNQENQGSQWLSLADYGVDLSDFFGSNGDTVSQTYPITEEQQAEIEDLLLSPSLIGLRLEGGMASEEVMELYACLFGRMVEDGMAVGIFSLGGMVQVTVFCQDQNLCIQFGEGL